MTVAKASAECSDDVAEPCSHLTLAARAGPIPPRRLVRYVVAARDSLPIIDVTRSIKDELLPMGINRIYSRTMYRIRHLIAPCYALAVVLRVTSFFVSSSAADMLAPISVVLNLPATLMVPLSLRAGFVKVLIRQFEFWYFAFLNSMWVAALALKLSRRGGDTDGTARLCLLPFMWIEFTNATLLDAYFLKIDAIIYAAAITILQLLALNVAIVFNLIHDASHVVMFESRVRSATTQDVALFTSNAVIFLMARLVYRQRHLLRHPTWGRRRSVAPTNNPKASERVQVIAYRVELVLTEIEDPVFSGNMTHLARLFVQSNSNLAIRSDRGRREQPLTNDGTVHISMRLTRTQLVTFKPPDLLRSYHCLSAQRVYHLDQVVAWAAAIGAFVSGAVSCTSLNRSTVGRNNEFELPGAAATAVILTLLVLVCSARHSSAQLLTRCLHSFDWVLLSLKLTTAHVCTCDMLRWNPHASLMVLCSWLWWHWVLLLDALPPVSRKHLGIPFRWSVTSVLLVSVATQAVLGCELLFLNQWFLFDRELFRWRVQHRGRDVVQTVAPFLISRLVAIWIWSWRLIYRTWRAQSGSEFLVLKGTIEYDRPIRRANKTRQLPNPPSG